MRRITLLALAAALPVVAQASPPSLAAPQDPYLSDAIVDGRLQVAETQLTRALQRRSDLPEVRLNLAQIYHQTGREAAAAALYRQVLASPDADLLMANGRAASAHALAERGLARGLRTAAR